MLDLKAGGFLHSSIDPLAFAEQLVLAPRQPVELVHHLAALLVALAAAHFIPHPASVTPQGWRLFAIFLTVIVGMMLPLMNWARKLAWWSASLRTANSRSAPLGSVTDRLRTSSTGFLSTI